MKIKHTTVLDANIETVWERLQDPKLLDFIAKPLIRFVYVDPIAPGDTWKERDHFVKMRILGFIPFGGHHICIEVSNDNNSNVKKLRDNGYGTFISTWDHWIILKRVDKNTTEYTDEVTIKAGVLTVFVWLYAFIFYKWRQRRWKILVKNNFKQLDQ